MSTRDFSGVPPVFKGVGFSRWKSHRRQWGKGGGSMTRFDKLWFKPAAGIVGLALLLLGTSALCAQQPDPNVRAARLSYVEGDVQIAQGNQLLANPALANTPLFQGTEVTTKEDGRAEIQFDDGSVTRVSPNSTLKIITLRQQGGTTDSEVQLESGLAYFELQGDTSGSRMIVHFGDGAVTASGFTVLRVNLDNPPGELAVFTGNAHLERANTLSLDLHGGESVAFNATDPSLYNLAEVIEPDSWDAWNADRDQQLTSQEATRTAASGSEPNSSNPAWSDLDANGNWYNVPGQGYVWSPYEASSGDWDPYGCGNWVSTPQYGYIWVSCEQWGYLPYSEGDWNFYDGFGWGWTPGYGYPWWINGGWGFNIGNRPVRYEPPRRPHGGPIGRPIQPIRRGGIYQPNPVIAVNRIPKSTFVNSVRTVGQPANIAGNTVEPLRPLSPRPVYSPSMANGFSRSYEGSGVAGAPRYGYSGAAGSPRYGSGYVPWVNAGAGRAPGGSYYPAPSHGYSPGAVSRPATGGAAPHVSSGGGHPSGGGGGGGVAHPSGGGGGAAAGHH